MSALHNYASIRHADVGAEIVEKVQKIDNRFAVCGLGLDHLVHINEYVRQLWTGYFEALDHKSAADKLSGNGRNCTSMYANSTIFIPKKYIEKFAICFNIFPLLKRHRGSTTAFALNRYNQFVTHYLHIAKNAEKCIGYSTPGFLLSNACEVAS